ncbi:hypothetical protein SAMN05421780_101791 [Flexibacter flexilis DSM 6793]|uniref:Uncharacterized protein n=1 Tax=Flexibacter flexilis DSM 6793 TaxID=927664 RepID=A0A1I1EHC0_9BACT|nr:hypothetical protein [Flexibacter flexilis]SFB86022.1 hypothetical protein SAMN05421780_101791 [Flexibacter flexilis DSM 6793]
MDIRIEVPAFTVEKGIKYKWENGFEIETKYENGVISIVANKEGLVSLANHLLNLAQKEVPSGYHLHFDEYNSLEENSLALIIQKK